MELKDKIVNLLDEKQIEDITVINFKDHSPFLDHFVIGTARNGRNARATISYLEELCDKEKVSYHQGFNNDDSKWYLFDAGSVVVHLFFDSEREKYDLEGLWKDLIEK